MKEYSFLNTVLLVNGVEITGFDEGDDVIVLSRINDAVSHKIGADGEMSISISADRSGTCTFKLQQSSLSNAYLTGLVAVQENGLFVPIFVQMTDTRTGDSGSGTSGYIAKPADMQRGTNVNGQEWVITVERLDLIHIGATTL